MPGGQQSEGTNGGGEGEKPSAEENLIYDSESELYVVYDPADVSPEYVDGITNALLNYGIYARARLDTEEKKPHEIVIGKVDREISDTAYMFLERISKNSDDDLRYCIYSDGSSVAIAFDGEGDGYAADAACEYFSENFAASRLTLKKGEAASVSFELYEYLGERDKARRDELFDRLESLIGGQNGIAIREAFEALYTIYDGEALISWLCNLYDSDICVCTAISGESECKGTVYCGTGGFYYSNSARDNYGFLPDAESTMQALNFLGDCGIAPSLGSYKSLLPDWMAEEICDYLYNLQDPDGFFYHPQWGKTIGNSKRGRDSSWCKTILKKYGVELKYDTINDVVDTDPVSGVYLSGMLGGSTVAAVSKVVLAESETLIPDHLKTLDAFKAYLVRLDIPNNSYGAGNTLSAQCGQIIAMGNAYVNALEEHLNACQNENGIWHEKTDYYGINGLMKISGVYNMIGKAIPNADLACKAAFAAVSSDEEIGDIVDIWNAWDAAKRVILNIGSYAENGGATAKSLRDLIMADAAVALIHTRAKLSVFRKMDGSFSYEPNNSSHTSQGSVIALKGVNEGDMNATAIATTYMINTLFECLGLEGYKVPFAGKKEKAIFDKTINNLVPIKKNGEALLAGEAYDFDYDNEGSTPSRVVTKGTTTSMVVADDRGNGNAFKFNSESGAGSYLTIKNLGVSGNATGMVFESDLCILTENVSSGNLRLDLASEGELDIAYRVIFKQNGDRIELWDSASGSITNNQSNYLGISVENGEWFKLRIEYYAGDEDSVRAKIFLNGKLTAVSDNFFDNDGVKLTGEGNPKSDPSTTRFYVLKAAELTMLVDNVSSYYTNEKYTYEELSEEYLTDPYSFNADRIDQTGVTYGFEDREAADDFPDGVDVSGGYIDISDTDSTLKLSADALATFFAQKRGADANCSTVSLDLTVNASTLGRLFRINFLDRNELYTSITDYSLYLEESEGGYVLSVTEGHTNVRISGMTLPVGEKFNLRIDYYEKEGVVLLYVDGVMEGMLGTLSTTAKRYVFGRLQLKCYGGDITVDNVVAERGYKNYEDAVKPKYDGKIYDFENGKDNVILGGSASISTSGGDSELRISATDKTAFAKIPLLERDDVLRSSYLGFDLSFSTFSAEGETLIIALTDGAGEGIVSFALSVVGEEAVLYEKTALGTHSAKMLSFNASDGGYLSFEYYELYGVCKIYLDGEYVTETALLYSAESRELSPEYLTVSAAGAKNILMLDDLEAYRANLIYIPESSENKEEGSSVIGFDYSGGGNFPSVITHSIYSGAPTPSVVESIRDGRLDKVIKFESYVAPNAGMDALKLNPTAKNSAAVSYVFQADLMIKDHISSLPVQFNLWGPTERAIEINFDISGGVIHLYHTGEKSKKKAVAEVGEWFNLRVEYYTVNEGDTISVKTKVFIDGELLYESEDYEGAKPVSTITYASFNALKGSGVTMLLDNLSLEQSTKTYDGE